MSIDRSAAETFIWSTARLVDRHRYAYLFHDAPAQHVSDALAGYGNPDGGFGHALEPDLRSPGSQPAATFYALEMLEEVGRQESEQARDARRWVASISEPGGGIPFLLPGFEPYPHSFWFQPQPGSFLTLALAAVYHSSGVTGDDWLTRGTQWCWEEIDRVEKPGGYWLKFACQFLDAVPDEERARAAIGSLRARLDPGVVAVGEGIEGEALRPLDLSPQPGARTRALFEESLIESHLDVVEREQKDDGGWEFDWLAWSPAQTTAWRGIVTIRALRWLRDSGRG